MLQLLLSLGIVMLFVSHEQLLSNHTSGAVIGFDVRANIPTGFVILNPPCMIVLRDHESALLGGDW